MIFPFLLSGVFILKFHYLLWQVFFSGNETARISFWLLAGPPPLPPTFCPASVLHPGPPPYTVPGNVAVEIPEKVGERDTRPERLELELLHFETPAYRGKKKKTKNLSMEFFYLKGKYQSIDKNDPLQ